MGIIAVHQHRRCYLTSSFNLKLNATERLVGAGLRHSVISRNKIAIPTGQQRRQANNTDKSAMPTRQLLNSCSLDQLETVNATGPRGSGIFLVLPMFRKHTR